MSIVRYVNKKTGRVALYESTSHYDPETKQSRPIRKYLGTEDPETGELIPSSGKRGRKKGADDHSSHSKKETLETDYRFLAETLKKECVPTSYVVTAYQTAQPLAEEVAADSTDTEDEYKVYTIGDPYCIYVTDNEGNEVPDYSVNPLILTLSYTDEMLSAAGFDAAQAGNIAMYMYSEEVYGYVCIGGTVDTANKSVSVEVTKPGQYLLAVDSVAPSVKSLTVSKDTNKPVITAAFQETSGFKEFSMKLDGEEVIGTANWKNYYNRALNSLSYQVERELADGKHICSVYAVDTAGNAMPAPYEVEFYIGKEPDPGTGEQPDPGTGEQPDPGTGEQPDPGTGEEPDPGTGEEPDPGTGEKPDPEPKPDLGDVLEGDIPSDGVIPDGIWAAGIVDTAYTGTNTTQDFRVYDGKRRLKEKKDYTVSYKNNKAAYTYTDGDYKAFEEKLKQTGQSIKTGTFDPKKAPQAVIRMKGNYSGKRSLYFKIEPMDVSMGEWETDQLTATYTGKKQTPVPKLSWNGKALKYGRDFYIPEYDQAKSDKNAFKESRDYALTITGKNNFKGEIPVTLTISKSAKQISMNKVTVKGIQDIPWTGQQIVQSGFTVKYKNSMLSEENGDYTIRWGSNTDAGKGTVTFTGTGEDKDGDGFSFVGSKRVSFKITGKPMSKAVISGLDKSYTYTGTEVKPTVSLIYQDNKSGISAPLTEGVHYKVTYQKNREKGTATVLFTGLASGGYTGTKKQTFKILSKPLGDDIRISFKDTENGSVDELTMPYRKGGAKPQVVVTFGGLTLEQDRDYKVSYTNDKKPALSTDANAPAVVITGKGNYSGSKKAAFSISAKPLTNENGITVFAKDKTESGKQGGYRQSFKVYDVDGVALGKDDYETKNAVYTLVQTQNADGTSSAVNQLLDQTSVVSAGSVIRITVPGKGIYAGGEATCTYRIIENNRDINKAVIGINNQIYTGAPVLITDQSQLCTGKVFIKLGGEKKELILGRDLEVVPGSYVKNVSKGTAKVTFRGINDFGGTKTVSFKIGTRSVTGFWKGIYTKAVRLFGT